MSKLKYNAIITIEGDSYAEVLSKYKTISGEDINPDEYINSNSDMMDESFNSTIKSNADAVCISVEPDAHNLKCEIVLKLLEKNKKIEKV